MQDYILKPVEERLLPELAGIYNYYVMNSTATFHMHEVGTDEMRAILNDGDKRFPSFVIYDGETLCGYCLLTHYKKREAYDQTAEVTLYLKPGYEKRGIGSVALGKLEAIAAQNGFHVLLAVICGENDASIGLFTKAGYDRCACFREVGKKFGRLLDVVCYQKILGPAL
jgi:phosphinothricin acetyltransferase